MSRAIVVLALVAAASSMPSATALTSVKDGYWYCLADGATPPEPNSCAFTSGSGPAPGDVADIQHQVTLWGQTSNPSAPLEVDVAGVDLHPGGTLGIYESRLVRTSGAGLWSGGGLDFCCNGGGSFENGGTLTVAGGAVATINGGHIVNSGTWIVADGGTLLSSQGGGSPFENGAGAPATLELQGNAYVYMSQPMYNGGLLLKSGAGTANWTGALNLVQHPDPGSDAGRVHVAGGTLRFADDTQNSRQTVILGHGASFDIDAGAVLLIADGAEFNDNPDGSGIYEYDGSGAGHLVLAAGGTIDGVAGPAQYGALFDFPPGFFLWSGGQLGGGPTLFNSGEITLVGDDVKTLGGGYIYNSGTIHAEGSQLDFRAVLTNGESGVIELGDGSHLVNAFNGRLINYGLVRKAAGNGVAIFEMFSGTPDSFGTLEVDAGELDLPTGGGAQMFGTLRVAAGAWLRRVPEHVGNYTQLMESCLLAGLGQLTTDSLIVQGRVAPGPALGLLTLEAAVNLQPTALLEYDVAGASLGQYDQISVTGDLYPGGTVRLRFGNGFAPHAGDSFDLVQLGGNLQASLAQIGLQFVNVAPGFQAQLAQVGNVIRLTALNDAVVQIDEIFADRFDGNP